MIDERIRRMAPARTASPFSALAFATSNLRGATIETYKAAVLAELRTAGRDGVRVIPDNLVAAPKAVINGGQVVAACVAPL